MIRFDGLSSAIARIGAAGSSLASLKESPTSRAAIGILAERSGLEIVNVVEDPTIELYRCVDKMLSGFQFNRPFAFLCLQTDAISSQEDAQNMFEQVLGLLRYHDLHTSFVIVLVASEKGGIQEMLRLSGMSCILLTPRGLVDILTSHPPRVSLIRLIRMRTPLSLINPYIYKGPVPLTSSLFVGRSEQLKKLGDPQTSYALVGPRAIGKTSLMNRAHKNLEEDGWITICVECSPTMSELDLVYQILDRFIREYNASPSLLTRVGIQRMERLIEDYADKEVPKKRSVVVFIDEADEILDRFPSIAASLRHCHNRGWARFVLLGYKGLRKAISDFRRSSITNVFQEMSLSGLSIQECGALVQNLMVEMGITFQSPEKVVETIYRESGKSPSRIQLLCHFLVESLNNKTSRVIGPEEAEAAINLPPVRKVLSQWFNDSTTMLEKFLAGLASLHVPCPEETLVVKARDDLPELTGTQIRLELQDLITANVLEYQDDGCLNFTFPAMRSLARPLGSPRVVMADLRKLARQSLRRH